MGAKRHERRCAVGRATDMARWAGRAFTAHPETPAASMGPSAPTSTKQSERNTSRPQPGALRSCCVTGSRQRAAVRVVYFVKIVESWKWNVRQRSQHVREGLELTPFPPRGIGRVGPARRRARRRRRGHSSAACGPPAAAIHTLTHVIVSSPSTNGSRVAVSLS